VSFLKPSHPQNARFDIKTFDFNSEQDEKGMLVSSSRLNELITAEIGAGIDASRIVLGGFSQGGAMSLLTGLTSDRKLAGLAVLSGFLPLHHKFKTVSIIPTLLTATEPDAIPAVDVV